MKKEYLLLCPGNTKTEDQEAKKTVKRIYDKFFAHSLRVSGVRFSTQALFDAFQEEWLAITQDPDAVKVNFWCSRMKVPVDFEDPVNAWFQAEIIGAFAFLAGGRLNRLIHYFITPDSKINSSIIEGLKTLALVGEEMLPLDLLQTREMLRVIKQFASITPEELRLDRTKDKFSNFCLDNYQIFDHIENLSKLNLKLGYERLETSQLENRYLEDLYNAIKET